MASPPTASPPTAGPAAQRDPLSKPRVLLSVLNRACFERFEGEQLFTAISAGFGRFECDRLLKPSGVELMNLPHSANIEISVLRRCPGNTEQPKQLLYHGLVSLGAVFPHLARTGGLAVPGEEPPQNSWESWLGLFSSEQNLKAQSPERLFQRCQEMGSSSARFPRLLVRMQYLPPGVAAAPQRQQSAGAAVVPREGSVPPGRGPTAPGTSQPYPSGMLTLPSSTAGGASATALAATGGQPLVMESYVAGFSAGGDDTGSSIRSWSKLGGAPPTRSEGGALEQDLSPHGQQPTPLVAPQQPALQAQPGPPAYQHREVPQPAQVQHSMKELSPMSSIPLLQMQHPIFQPPPPLMQQPVQLPAPSSHQHLLVPSSLRPPDSAATTGSGNSGGCAHSATATGTRPSSEDLRSRLSMLEHDNLKLRERESARESAERAFFEKVAPSLAMLGRRSLGAPAAAEGVAEHAAAVASSPSMARARLEEAAEVFGEAARCAAGVMSPTGGAGGRAEEDLIARIGRLEADLRVSEAERARLLCGVGPTQAPFGASPCGTSASTASAAAGVASRQQGRRAWPEDGGRGRGLDADRRPFFYKPLREDAVDCMLAASLLRLSSEACLHVETGFDRLAPGLYRFGGADGPRFFCRSDGAGRLLLRPAADAGHAEGAAAAELELRAFLESQATLAAAAAA